MTTDRRVTCMCQEHTDTTLFGWWIHNGNAPTVCDQCNQRAEWVLVQPVASVLHRNNLEIETSGRPPR